LKGKTIGPRVFSVFFHPNPHITAVGGAVKRFLETSRVFVEKGLELFVLESNPSLLRRKSVYCQVYTLQSPISAHRGWFMIYLDWILWAVLACFRSVFVIRRTRCSVVLAPNNTVPNLLPAYFAHVVTHLPLCVVAHHMDVTSENSNKNFRTIFQIYRKTGYSSSISFLKTLAFLIITRLLKEADVCITVSDFTAQTLTHLGIEPHRIHVSGNGVDLQAIHQVLVPQKKAYSVVFVGRISKEKGVFDLLEAWRRTVSERKCEPLLIIGTGPDLPKVQKMVVSYELRKNVVVCGGVNDIAMYSLLKSSRVFVFPSRFEGWGLAVAEALACGLPVVCYDLPALREVFGECQSVFFVPLGDIKKLSAATLKMLELKQEKYDEFAQISENYARRFDWDEVALRDLRVIRELTTN
jgi:glycosyltransferase involved in cell wall biosynthesis